MIIKAKLLTVDEFWEQYAGQRVELVKGVPIEMTPTSDLHGEITSLITFYMTGHVLENDLGGVRGAETGFLLQRDPDILRAADVAFIAKGRLALIKDRSKFTPIPPDLAVEVVSPHDRASEIKAKTSEYLEAGIRLVWIIYPEQQEITVHYPDGHSTTLGREDTLTGGDVLPGFSLPLVKLFPTD